MNGGFSIQNLAAATAATISVSGSADSTNYPSTLLEDASPAPRFKLSAKTSTWLKVDLGSSLNVKIIALLNHNLTSSATVVLQGHASDSWGTPSYSHSMTYAATHIFLVIDQTYRWWRVTIDDSTNTQYPAVGEFYVGGLTTFTINFDFPSRVRSYKNITEDMPSGRIRKLNQSNIKTYQLAWELLTMTQLAEVQAIHTGTNGGVTPFVFLPDVASTELLYVQCADDLQYQEIQNDLVGNVSLPLSELPNGISV